MEIKLGQLVEGTERDAFHVAVIPVVAAQYLGPGTHIRLNEEGKAIDSKPYIGIVDPFLEKAVLKGQRFLLWLYPNTVTGMRHHWSHPSFPEASETQKAEIWIRNYANEIGVSYERLMNGALDHILYDKRICLSEDTPDIVWQGNDQFWAYYEEVAGTLVPEEKKTTFFRCAC